MCVLLCMTVPYYMYASLKCSILVSTCIVYASLCVSNPYVCMLYICMCVEECRCHNEAPTLLFVKTCLFLCIYKLPTRSVKSEYYKRLYKNITTATF